MKKSLLFLPIILGIIVLISVPSVVAQSETSEILNWVKGIASFWVQGEITDTEFIEAIEFLVEQRIINLPNFQKIPPVILEDNPVVVNPEPIIIEEEQINTIEEEPEPLIHVTTNKKSYQSGDNIIIRGTVPIESQDIVTTVIVNPNGNIVTITQNMPNNGVFQTIFKAGSSIMNTSGEYEVRAQQGSEKNSVTFNFILDSISTTSTTSTPPAPIAEPEPVAEPAPIAEPESDQ